MIAVLGATGFTGHRAVRALRRAYPDEEIIAVVRAASDRRRLVGTEVTFRIADLNDRSGLRDALHTAQRIVCTVSLGFGHAPNICGAAAAESRDHVVFLSTTAVFTQVSTETREVRLAAEREIESTSLAATILRPTMIYGRPGDRNMERLVRFLRKSPIMPVVAGGRALQQPVHVDDVAAAVVSVFQAQVAIGRTYNLPGPSPLSFADITRLAAAAVGRRVILVSLPPAMVRPVFRAWRQTGRWPRISAEQIDRIVEDKTYTWREALADFSYNPRSFSSGITEEAMLLDHARRS